jgi:plasmid stability protein
MPTATVDSSLKLVRLELPESVHKQFRVEAAKEGVSMAAMARRLVEEWVVRRKAGGK